MWPRGDVANLHPAAPILHELSTKGCPANINDNWTHDMIITALKKGPHISAKLPEAKAYLIKETEDKIKQGFMRKVRWGDIKHNYPKNLKISPLAMIPHKSRNYRTAQTTLDCRGVLQERGAGQRGQDPEAMARRLCAHAHRAVCSWSCRPSCCRCSPPALPPLPPIYQFPPPPPTNQKQQ